MYALDHLVVSAEHLSAGRAWAESLLDVSMSARGMHTQMGTHNHLVALDPAAYFEVIAVDPDAEAPEHARWYNLDAFTGTPRLSTWVVQCDNLEEAQRAMPENSSRVLSFSRGAYAWRMLIPHDGVPLFGGCFPTLIEWESKHPAPELPNCDLRLRRLKLMHPKADELKRALEPFQTALDHVSISKGTKPKLQAEIGTSTGEIWIA